MDYLRIKFATLAAFSVMLVACGNFKNLKENIETLEQDYRTITGEAGSNTCSDCNVIIAVLSGTEERSLSRYFLTKVGESFSFKIPNAGQSAFIFSDVNQNFTYDKGEEYAWLDLQSPEAASASNPAKVVLKQQQVTAPTFELGNLLLAANQSIDFQEGTITQLSNPIFSEKSASQGMWSPVEFVLEGKAGVYFLETYSPKKVPILFVHGIAGNPAEFSTIISQLDRTQYQPWIFFYPSGLELKSIARGLETLMTELLTRHRPEKFHLVAHSMGGLVSREYLSLCAKAKSCESLASFTSIASPFGGHAGAQGGVDYSPVVMPVWRDMAPKSDFLTQLPTNPLPTGVPHHLVLAYLPGESSDGVIEITSQLHQPIQAQTRSVHGFEGSHTGVLKDPMLIDYLKKIWSNN